MPPTTTEHAITIEPGATGAQVQKLQTALHVKADGVFGPETEDAVYEYQATQQAEPEDEQEDRPEVDRQIGKAFARRRADGAVERPR